MNVTAHQEKKENEETKKGKRGAGEKKKRKQATDFKEAVCCPSAVVQGAVDQASCNVSLRTINSQSFNTGLAHSQ